MEMVQVLYVEDVMQSKARGEEPVDLRKKQITAHKLSWGFISLEDGNPQGLDCCARWRLQPLAADKKTLQSCSSSEAGLAHGRAPLPECAATG